jgi:hypothetical protein
MLTPNLPDADTLILDQLDIPGKTGPVSESPKVWGINIAAALGNFPRQGLLCRAGPWTPMEIGDQIKVFWNKEVEVQQKTVGPADVNTTLQMFVPSARIPEGRAVASYSVKRLGQAWEPSEDMQVLVKLTRPGGHDDNNDPGHSKLIMRLPQDILDGGIDKDNVAAGVPVTIESYPDIAAGDVIQVSWGGVFVLSAPLTQDQADGKTPLVVHVSEAVIREAGDSDGVGLSVAFEVYDKVDNRSEDWSAAQRVVVAIDASRLEAPILKEAQSNVLDIDQLGDAPGTAQVWVTTGGSFQPGDTPIIRVKGTPVEGLPIDVEFAGEPLTSVPTTAEIPIANAVLRQMAKSQIALSYRLKKASGAPDMPSKSQFISAIGAIKRLAAPKALDAVSGALDPTLKQVRIEIPFDTSFAAGQAIKLFWLGTRPELIPYLPELPLYPLTAGDISAGKPLLIPIDGAHLTPINGGKLELYYQLLIEDAALGAMNHVNATHAIRESIHADILQVGEPRLELPEPVVAGVIDGALPGDTAGTTLTVNYLNTAKGDEVIYEWIGSKTGTKTDGITLSSLTEGKPVAFRIDAEYISGNNGGTVLAKYHIKRAAGGTSYSNALEFRVGNALENPLPIARLPQATGSGASVTLAPLDAQTGAKVIVAYAGMNDGHSIQLTVVGKPGAGSPIIPAKQGSSSGSIEFLIGPEAIAANIGNGSTTFTLSYEVTLDSNKIPSLPLTVTVTPLPAAELDKISIEQAEGLVLDLSKVTAGATIVSGIWAFIAVQQRVKLTLTGKKNNGEALNLDVWPWPSSNVNQNWIDSGRYAYTLAYNDIKDLADGTDLELHFKAALSLSPTETDAIIAPVKCYKIRGNALENPLPVARLPQASGTGASVTLAPLDAITGARVIVAYTGMNDGHSVQLTVVGKPGAGSPSIPAKTGSSSGSIEFLIEPEAIAANIGNGSTTFTLSYEVTLGSNKIPSQPLTVTVTPLPAAELDKISIEQAEGLVLDLSKVTAGATIVSGIWAFIAVQQRVKLTLTGKKNNGEALNLDVWPWPSSNVNQNWIDSGRYAHTLAYNDIKDLADGTDLELHFKAALSLSPTETDAIIAPVKRYKILAVEDLKPTITSIKDSKGIAIPQNSFTVDPNVKVSGTAARNQTILIYNNGVSTGGSATADDQGNWNRDLIGLAQGECKLTAVAQYGTGLESAEWKIIVTPLVTPTITSIKDSKGVEIPPGGTTVDTHVILTGTASKGQTVDVLDGTVSKGKPPVDPTTGIWTRDVSGLSIAAHSFTAKAEYGTGAVSAARTFNVAALVTPVITSVLDSKGIAIPQNGLTVDSSVKVSGTATPHQTILINNNNVSTGGFATADAQGKWERNLIGLAQGDCNLTAVAQYGSNPASVIWKIIVTPMITPIITSVKDSKNSEIPNGGNTFDTRVTLSGTASKGQRVEVFDESLSIGKPLADPTTGQWEQSVSDLSFSPHKFTATARYGNEPISTTWSISAAKLENFDDMKPVNIGHGTVVRLKYMTITLTLEPPNSGYGVISTNNFSEHISGLNLLPFVATFYPPPTYREMQITFDQPLSKIAFWHWSNQQQALEIVIHYGNTQTEVRTVPSGKWEAKFEFSADRITKIVFLKAGILDNFELTR